MTTSTSSTSIPTPTCNTALFTTYTSKSEECCTLYTLRKPFYTYRSSLRSSTSSSATTARSTSAPVHNPLRFYEGLAFDPATIQYRLAQDVENAINNALTILPHHQVRARIQAILALGPPSSSNDITPAPSSGHRSLSSRLAPFANRFHDDIED